LAKEITPNPALSFGFIRLSERFHR
jgi:hypothetical protein